MINPTIPTDEKARLAELQSYNILDTLSEEDYDHLTAIASSICGTKIALISLIDQERQWFKSHHGLNATETPREQAFCAHAINMPTELFVVEDARIDDRFHDNPLVVGEPHVVFYAGMPLLTDNGFALGTLCVIDDKPKALNQGQIDSLKMLSKQVIHLLELRKKKAELEQSFVKLEKKNQELEQFAFTVAHDLKSPLNVIIGLSDLFMQKYKGQFDADGMKIMDTIKGSTSKLAGFISELLEYSRLEKILGEDKIAVDVAQLEVYLSSLFAADKNCQLKFVTTITTLLVNKTALEQSLANLMTNALKYNDKLIAEVEVGIHENEAAYIFYVKDNGPGIAPANQEKIFRIFETSGTVDRYGKKGHGIGLATVKKIVEKQGGELRVESALGAGSNFIFTLKK